jgi:hypothetical protein
MLKYFNNRKKKGQSTLEYAVLIIIIIGALLSIQVYIKRGVQGRLKSATDDIGDQFSPGNMNVIVRTTTTGQTNQLFQAGVSTTNMLTPEATTTTTNAQIYNQFQEFWG